MRARILMAALAAIPMAVSAHADTPASPYTGQQTRSIKALSPGDIDELRKGGGMGLAKAAETWLRMQLAYDLWHAEQRAGDLNVTRFRAPPTLAPC